MKCNACHSHFELISDHFFPGLVTDYRVSDVIRFHFSSWTSKTSHLQRLQTATLFLLCPAALADSTGKTIPLFKNVVCLPDIWDPRAAGLHTQGRRQIIADAQFNSFSSAIRSLSAVHIMSVFSKLLFSKSGNLLHIHFI